MGKKIRRKAKSATKQPAAETAVTDSPVTKIYSCFDWPHLLIAGRVRFKDGFFVTDDRELQGVVERATGFGSQIRDVTEPAQRQRTMSEGAKLYLCFAEPELTIDHRLTFCDGVFATEREEIQRLVEQSPRFGTHIREIPAAVMIEARAAGQERARAEA